MPEITGLAVVQTAFSILNVYLPSETPSANDGAFALGQLNRMIGGWSQRAMMIPVIARERFELVEDQGGPDDPYTIGVDGDFDTAKPANQNSIVGANLILTTPVPEVRVRLGIATDDAYAANAIPDMSSGQPTGLYYSPTYEDDLGSIFLWPVPDTDENEIELFIQRALTRFSALSTALWVPEGVDDAMVYNLALRLSGPYGRQMSADDRQLAVSTLSLVKRSNTKLSDLPNDAYWATYGRGTLYNINTGN